MRKVTQIKEAKDSEFFTVEEAARELGVKPTAIRNYLYDEKLRTFKFKTLTLLSKSDVEKYREERQ